jgi:putative membrane protein
MTADLVLASVHHLLAFGLFAVLTAELMLVRYAVHPVALRRLGVLDAMYGVVAVALVIVGFARVFHGPKGADFYLHNPVFWTKIALFAAVGLLSIVPTVRILRWQKRLKADAGWQPPATELQQVRRFVMIEIHIAAFIPIAAAMMARGVGL